MSFYEHAFLEKGFAADSKAIDFNNFRNLTIKNKHLRNSLLAVQRTKVQVSPETIKGRIKRFRLFLEWLYHEFHADNRVQSLIENKFEKLIAKVKLDESRIGNNTSKTTVNTTDSVIPDKIFLALLDMLLPSSSQNPFKSSRVRNFLIVSILMQSGVRRGAVAKMKISDCKFHKSYDRISVYRSENDPTDPRIDKPSHKTRKNLEAVIEKSLMMHLQTYINNTRVLFPNSAKHDFIFVSEKNSKGTAGNPLSLKAINSIFQKLSKSLGFQIHPHLLRYKWNEIFDDKAESNNIDSRVKEDIRNAAMAWTHNSSMGSRYNEIRLHKKAAELMTEHQARIESKHDE
jgi:integrase